MSRKRKCEEVWMMKSLLTKDEKTIRLGRTWQRTSLAPIRRRGSYIRHLLNRFRVSALAAVKRSRRGVLGNCPTGT
jgi:hypothetical protein